MPTISYGSTFGGTPVQYDANDYAEWCREIGFNGPASVNTSSEIVNGALFWCRGYDEQDHKWCDYHDGHWRDATLGYNSNAKFNKIQKLTCSTGSYGLIQFRLFLKKTFILTTYT